MLKLIPRIFYSRNQIMLGPNSSTFLVIGAGFSVDAGMPLTRDVLREAFRIRPDIVGIFESFLIENSIIHGPLVEQDIENLLLELSSKIDFPRPHFRQYLSPGLIQKAFRESLYEDKESGTIAVRWSDVWRTLLLLYFTVVTNYYEPNPVLSALDENSSWLEETPTEYIDFCKALPHESYLVTTNYDDVLERSLLDARRAWAYGCSVHYTDFIERIDFKPGQGVYHAKLEEEEIGGLDCLIWARADWRPPEASKCEDITLCKLHGSFRWIQCRDCSRVYSVDYWGAHPVGDFIGFSQPPSHYHTFTCWNQDCHFTPLTVALLPGEIKKLDVKNSIIDDQWIRAIRAARRCRKLFVIGSSLRENDQRIIRLIRCAARRAEMIGVVNPSQAAVSRTEELLRRKVSSFASLGEFLVSQVMN